MDNPSEQADAELTRTLRYLCGTADFGLCFRASRDEEPAKVNGYFDADHADCVDTIWSTMAYVFSQNIA